MSHRFDAFSQSSIMQRHVLDSQVYFAHYSHSGGSCPLVLNKYMHFYGYAQQPLSVQDKHEMISDVGAFRKSLMSYFLEASSSFTAISHEALTNTLSCESMATSIYSEPSMPMLSGFLEKAKPSGWPTVEGEILFGSGQSLIRCICTFNVSYIAQCTWRMPSTKVLVLGSMPIPECNPCTCTQ